MIAVHCGAGVHSGRKHRQYNKLCKKACQKGIQVLSDGGTALEAVKAAVVVLEDNPLTNAGYGSNLTTNGMVEVDASIMDGKNLTYGGCGAIRNIKNPVLLAYDLCVKQSETLPLGLIPPSFLVGAGGKEHAMKAGLTLTENKLLVTKKAYKQLKRYKKYYEERESFKDGVITGGGLLLKRPGRVGQAALFGTGAWADSLNKDEEPSIAICTTGCGEHLIQTQLAREIAADLKNSSCATTDLSRSMTEKFMKSKFLRNVEQKMAGALVLMSDKSKGEISVLWGHSTETMSIGYMRSTDKIAKAQISSLPENVPVGKSINVGGTYFYSQMDDKLE